MPQLGAAQLAAGACIVGGLAFAAANYRRTVSPAVTERVVVVKRALVGKTILVTGAASGIGKEICA